MLATPVDSLRLLVVPGRGADQSSERGPCDARFVRTCSRNLRLSIAWFFHPTSTDLRLRSVRLLPTLVVLGLCVRSALANSSHGASHHRTASGNCFLGQRLVCRTHTSSGALYRERSRLRKHPERTNGTPRPVSDHRSQPRCVRCAVSPRASERNTSCTRTVISMYPPPALTSSTAASQRPRSNRDQQQAVQETSIGHLQNVNGTSTGHQPSVNGTSTNDQPNVNGTSNRGFSTRVEKSILW